MTQAVVGKQQMVVPKFTVTEIDEPRMRTKKVYNKTKKTFEDKDEEVSGGYLLKFPRGHSIVVDTMDEVKRLVGDPEQVALINLETSDEYGTTHQPVRKKSEVEKE